MEREETWSWIPHVEGADRDKEINAYLTRMVDELSVAKGPMMRWNPNTSSMEPFNYSDEQRGSFYPDAAKE